MKLYSHYYNEGRARAKPAAATRFHDALTLYTKANRKGLRLHLTWQGKLWELSIEAWDSGERVNSDLLETYPGSEFNEALDTMRQMAEEHGIGQ